VEMLNSKKEYESGFSQKPLFVRMNTRWYKRNRTYSATHTNIVCMYMYTCTFVEVKL